MQYNTLGQGVEHTYQSFILNQFCLFQFAYRGFFLISRIEAIEVIKASSNGKDCNTISYASMVTIADPLKVAQLLLYMQNAYIGNHRFIIIIYSRLPTTYLVNKCIGHVWHTRTTVPGDFETLIIDHCGSKQIWPPFL